MIKLILLFFLIFPHHNSFETTGTEKPQWKDWTVVDNDEHLCQKNGEYIVCPQSVQQPNAGPGRAYAITCGYIYKSPDIDICLESWLPYQVWIPFFSKQLHEWFIRYPHAITRMLVDLPDEFVLRGIRVEQVNIGYHYSWWERDPCWEEK